VRATRTNEAQNGAYFEGIALRSEAPDDKHGRVTPELENLFSFLRFPSISTDSQHNGDVRACANWLVAKLTGMGLAAELHETPQHPIVVARNAHVAGRRTVLIYGHYDVQPVDPLSLWASDPFEPVIRDGRIWARGATDNKGQMMAHVLGVEFPV
jgi:acetylornithine deacetylase/succinyl-diaminopimelate desuccinylase-like protein